MLLTFLLANIAVLFAAALQTSVGFGYAMMAVPLLALIDLQLVPGPAIFAGTLLTALLALDDRAAVDRTEVVSLMPALAVGTVFGALFLRGLPGDAHGIVFAVLILAAIAVTAAGFRVVFSRWSLAIAGFFAGFIGTTSGVYGAPLAVLYQREVLAKTRATVGMILTVAGVLSLLALALAGQFDGAGVVLGASMIPGAAVGFIVARRFQRFVPQHGARVAMLFIATSSALLLLVRSLL